MDLVYGAYISKGCFVFTACLLQYNCFPAENYSSEVTLGTITANYSLALAFKGSPAKLSPPHSDTKDLECILTATHNCND